MNKNNILSFGLIYSYYNY